MSLLLGKTKKYITSSSFILIIKFCISQFVLVVLVVLILICLWCGVAALDSFIIGFLSKSFHTGNTTTNDATS